VAGVAHMTYARFALYNAVGGCLWVGLLTVLGYLIGNTPWVQQNFSLVTLAMIIIPGLPAVYQVLKIALNKRKVA
jgi:membrane-associated protein